ncbi:MAG TPA: Ig-like domain-containing protein [Bacteroidales bacterium]|nr:Ig domain-containing protein [Bacteroidales bacterium]MDI9533879.1 Ig-like domain-containing protein [Bacteroidota bacterium]HNY56753.1 Ig-like domain-containing protein [Bacteroidales bacterium]HOH13797.1 Ig-like domain-containing protein [Bacteroidales bacterium]HPX54335.1 Ig-like domain-containing protein [Bacteroidales bacterium]
MKTNIFSVFSRVMALGLFLTVMVSCEKEIPVTSLTLDKAEATVQVGANLTLLPVIDPLNATNKEVQWTTSNASVATVTDGVVTGVALGSAIITAASVENPLFKAECNITVVPSTGQVITVSGDITTDTRWYAQAKYHLSGFVYVKNNATLTIEAGTIIKGVSNTKATLIIERGSKIIAAGTATQPIVFTSDKPAGQRASGDWGGVVICGKAKTNKHDDGEGVGIAEGGIGSKYGGSDDNDNSGILQFVRIEFPGIPLTSTANSEINGLTLYSVGKATVIDHIQVSYSGDDSFEWFGGNVNAKYLVALGGLDDAFDTDNGFSGKVQFGLILQDPLKSDQSGSNGFESDNDADGSLLTPVTSPIFTNVTAIGPLAVAATLPEGTKHQKALHLRRGTMTSIYNSVFVGFPQGLSIDGQKGNSPTRADANELQIENTILAGMTDLYVEKTGTVAVPYTVAQHEAYFRAEARNNRDDMTMEEVIGTGFISLTSPSLLPKAGSPLLSGASFTNARLTDSFFTVTSYRGAFGTENWTSGWCNWDPQNTVY